MKLTTLSAAALALTLAAATAQPSFAQDAGGTTMTTEDEGDDMGWIGLIGLAGLLGKKRNDNTNRH